MNIAELPILMHARDNILSEAKGYFKDIDDSDIATLIERTNQIGENPELLRTATSEELGLVALWSKVALSHLILEWLISRRESNGRA